MVSPSIESLGNEYSDGALVAKIDADENPELTAKYGIRNIPTILYIKDGEIVDKHVGVASRGQLEDKLKSILD